MNLPLKDKSIIAYSYRYLNSGISSLSSSNYLRCYLRAPKIKNFHGGECPNTFLFIPFAPPSHYSRKKPCYIVQVHVHVWLVSVNLQVYSMHTQLYMHVHKYTYTYIHVHVHVYYHYITYTYMQTLLVLFCS